MAESVDASTRMVPLREIRLAGSRSLPGFMARIRAAEMPIVRVQIPSLPLRVEGDRETHHQKKEVRRLLPASHIKHRFSLAAWRNW